MRFTEKRTIMTSKATESNNRFDIARRMLLAAPPGQLPSLEEDFQAIFAANGDTIPEDWLEQVRAETTKATTSSSDTTTPKAMELHEKMKQYQSDFYSSKGVVSVLVVEEKGDNLVVRTYAEQNDTANCQAGSWTADWTVSSSQQVKGTVKIHAFCHEGATVQLLSTREFGPLTTTNVVTQIEEWEQEAMDSIREMNDNMGDKLKSLRRVMPVTRTKMNWNVEGHRMVQLLGNASKK
jgi:hypothetical protein